MPTINDRVDMKEENSARTSPSRATYAEIAAKAGVCKATVSLALRNSTRISNDTQQRIKKIASDLDYRQNPLVSANMAQIRLAKKQKRNLPTIGLLSTWWDEQRVEKRVEWDIQSRFLEGSRGRAIDLGFDFDYLEFDLKYYSTDRIQQVLTNRNIAGLILAPLRFSNSRLRLDWSKFAVCTIGFSDGFGSLTSVFYDNFRCMQDVLQHLSQKGYQRIGFITDSENETRGGHLWNAGFLEYQDRLISPENRVPLLRIPKPELLFEEPEYESMHAWYKIHKPDVIIGFRSKILEHFQSIGYKVPEEFGYMVLNWSSSSDGCSGYRQCHEEMAYAAVDIVSGRLYNNNLGESAKPRSTLLKGDIITGDTLR